MSPSLRTTRVLIAAALALALTVPASSALPEEPLTPAAQQVLEGMLADVHYRAIGPTRQSGRFVDIAVPLQDERIIYAATASGGLWKSVNHGQSWESIFDVDDVFSIGAVAVAPTDPDTVWVGTGEGNNSRSAYWGNGVYKSTDAGGTWEHMGLPESGHIGRILVHPEDADTVYVAALGHLYSDNPERGLYKTTDGGGSWDLVLTDVIEATGEYEDETTRHIGVVDVAMDPRDPDVLYASTYDKVRKPWTFNPGGPGSRLYKSTDGGDDWTMLENGLPGGMLGRIGVAVAASDPDVVYAVIEDVNVEGLAEEVRYQQLLSGIPPGESDVNDRIWRSDDGGESWRPVSSADEHIGGTPPYYYGQIRVDPEDEDHIYVLSARSQESWDGGETWEGAWNFGGDDHALWIDPDDSEHMVMGYDHGMGVTWDEGETWYHPDDLPLAQFYAIGLDNGYPYHVQGGLQDNGSWRGPHTKPGQGPIWFEDWQRVGGGDGMYNVVDWDTNRYLYNESQFGPISRLDLETGERRSIRYERPEGEEDLRWNWNAPIVVSPHDADVVYHAANVVLKSTFRGENWTEISPDLTTNDPAKIQGTGNIQYCTIVSLDESAAQQGLLWAGTDDGNVWVTRNDGGDWTQVNGNITGNPGYWVSRVEPSSHDAGTAYVSFTGYRRDDFRPFLYRTTDFGATWTDISEGLPEEPINVVREDDENPDLLFVGTEMGVHVSIDGGMSWHSMKGDMPTQPVHDLKLHAREDDLVAATHGRGVFITDISWLQGLSQETLTAGDPVLFDVEPQVDWVDTDRKAVSSQNFPGESEPDAIIVNYFLPAPAAEAPVVRVYRGTRQVNEIEGPNEAGLNSVEWGMDVRRERTEEEMEQIRQRQERLRERFGDDLPARFLQDVEYASEPAPVGPYTVVLVVDGRELRAETEIIEDHWYEQRY